MAPDHVAVPLLRFERVQKTRCDAPFGAAATNRTDAVMTSAAQKPDDAEVRAADDGQVFVTHLEEADGWAAIPELNSQWMRFRLGDRADSSAPMAWVIELPPGFTVARHRHAVSRLEIVLSGYYEESDGKTRTPGSVSFFPADEFYGPLHFPEGGRMVEFFESGDNIEPIFDKMPDEMTTRYLTSIGMAPSVAGQ